MNELAVSGGTSDITALVEAEVERRLKDPASLKQIILTQSQALIEAQPKIDAHDALMRSENTMSITEAAKHFGMHVKLEVYPYLRTHGYLNNDDTPSQVAIDAQYLAIRQNYNRGNGKTYSQAVVLTSQLETWRTRVVPQIKKWMKHEA